MIMLFSCEYWVGGSGGCIFEQWVGTLATEEIRGLVGSLVSSLKRSLKMTHLYFKILA